MPLEYELVEHSNGFHDEHWCVKLNAGNYAGVVYQYDTVEFLNEGEDTVLKFNTITVENPNEEDLTSLEFESIIGDILVKIIAERMESSAEELNERTTSDNKESNT